MEIFLFLLGGFIGLMAGIFLDLGSNLANITKYKLDHKERMREIELEEYKISEKYLRKSNK